MKPKIIYSSYDGISGDIGQSQIIPYINFLSDNYEITIVSLEKRKNKLEIKKIKEKFFSKNIIWYNYYYSYNKFFQNILKIVLLNFIVFFLALKNNYSIIHIRSFTSFFLVLLVLYKKLKIIYDIRGFWIYEKIDRFNWNRKAYLTRLLLKIDCYFLGISDCIVTLTNESKNILVKKFPRKKIIKIPTCTNTYEFKEKKLYLKNIKNFGYLGSVTHAYNFNKVLIFIKKLTSFNKNIKLMIYSNSNKKQISDKIMKTKLLEKNYEIIQSKHNNINNELEKIDVGIFFLNKNYSSKASFPTKIAEFFAKNIPIICNDFNEDIVNILEQKKVGLIYDFKIYNVREIFFKINEIYRINSKEKNALKIARSKYSYNYANKIYSRIYNQINDS